MADKSEPPKLYATTAIDLPVNDYRDSYQEIWPVNTTVRVVMAHKTGELQITNEVDSNKGKLRVMLNTAELTDWRDKP